MESYRILIIGGHIRSGTTLLWRICNSHPDVMLTYEFNNFSSIGKSYLEYSKKILQRVWLRGLLSYNVLDNKNSNLNLLNKLATSINNNFFIMVYLYYVAKSRAVVNSDIIGSSLHNIFSDKVLVGDKYPDYVFHLNKFRNLDDVLCMIIYRDCRDVVSSTLKKVRTIWKNQKWINEYDTAEKIAKKWVETVTIMESHQDDIYTVRYEDLIHNTEYEINSIGNYLGIEFHAGTLGIVKEDRVGKYLSYLTENEIQNIIEVAGSTLSRLGYI